MGDLVLEICPPCSESSASTPESPGVNPRTVFIAGEAFSAFCFLLFFLAAFALSVAAPDLTTCTRPRFVSESSLVTIGWVRTSFPFGGLRLRMGVISGSSPTTSETPRPVTKLSQWSLLSLLRAMSNVEDDAVQAGTDWCSVVDMKEGSHESMIQYYQLLFAEGSHMLILLTDRM